MPHDGSHDPDCFGCRIKEIQVRTPRDRQNNLPPARTDNSWEKGILRDERGFPVRRNGKVIPVKQAAAERHKIEAEMRKLKQGIP